MKLNGWKRIGVIASVVWIMGAGAHTYDSVVDRFSVIIVSTHVQCDSNLAGKPETLMRRASMPATKKLMTRLHPLLVWHD